MNSEEARDILSVEYIYDSDRMHTAKTLAAEALEKQIPRKPIETKTMLKCPACGKVLMAKHYHHSQYCDKCGQNIMDWSEE